MTKNIYKYIQEVVITPYRGENGSVNFSDANLRQVFLRIAVEGTLHKVFFDKKINNNREFIAFVVTSQ